MDCAGSQSLIASARCGFYFMGEAESIAGEVTIEDCAAASPRCDEGVSAADTATLLLNAGAASVVVGALLYVWGWSKKGSSTDVAIGPVGSGQGVWVNLDF